MDSFKFPENFKPDSDVEIVIVETTMTRKRTNHTFHLYGVTHAQNWILPGVSDFPNLQYLNRDTRARLNLILPATFCGTETYGKLQVS